MRTVIPIEYRRPSALLNLMEPNGSRVVSLAAVTPDDAHGELIVQGSKVETDEVRKAVAMFDVPRQRAELAIKIDAPTDRMHLSQTVELYGGDTWTSDESQLGMKLTVSLKPQVGKTVTLKVVVEYRKHKAESEYRLPVGGSATQSFGKAHVDDPLPGIHLTEQTPTVTFKFMGLHGE